MEKKKRQALFSKIYEDNAWGSDESRSGSGSTLDETERLRLAIPELLENFQIRSVLDIPCGDFNWMKHTDLAGVHYVGADIVPKMIDSNKLFYTSEDREFKVLDVLTDDLPKVDMVICRDLFVHMTFADAMKALENITSSGARYLMCTTFTLHTNEELGEGMWRPLNMMEEPFNFPMPQVMLNEGNPHPYFCDKAIGVWGIA